MTQRSFGLLCLMLQTKEVDEMAREVAQKHLAALGVQNVHSEPATDSEGNEALRITITIQSAERIAESGGAFLKTLSEISRRLESSGDLRFPIIDYITEQELSSVDDPEA